MFWNVGLLADDAGAAIASLMCICPIFIVAMAVALIPLIGMWKLFEKAGKPGWAAIIPIYNFFVLTEISGKDIMWFFLLLVPCVGVVAAIMIWIDVAKSFGKDATYGILLALLPFIFVPLLGFSDARYLGPVKQV